jgi:hypothetical protein
MIMDSLHRIIFKIVLFIITIMKMIITLNSVSLLAALMCMEWMKRPPKTSARRSGWTGMQKGTSEK